MPTYEYRCESCGRAVEAFQAFTDAPLTTCETCGGSLRKVYAPVGIVFKGSGFYKTDSRGSGSKTASRTSSESGGDSGTDGAKDGAKDGSSTSTPADAGSKPKEPAATSSTSSTSSSSTPAKAAPSQPSRSSD